MAVAFRPDTSEMQIHCDADADGGELRLPATGVWGSPGSPTGGLAAPQWLTPLQITAQSAVVASAASYPSRSNVQLHRFRRIHPAITSLTSRTAFLLDRASASPISTMLSFILIQNRQGKTRLAKWYAPFSDEQKIKLKGEVHRLVAPRDQKYQSNFVEFRNNKIVYRRYAGLFFCACVDTNDNELAYLEAIHFFVEVLDAFFGNVCELDLVFNFYKVYAILDEVFLAGEIEETSKQVVLTRLEHLDKLE
ncbi:hypothetical protein MRS44_006463 [Fusarium solani]|nr:hypothetical protein MRS44_006463 [Fusarium solani]